MPPTMLRTFSHPSIKDWQDDIPIYGQEAYEPMRAIGAHAARCLTLLDTIIKPGITTEAIDSFVLTYALDNNLYPAPLNYKGFPKSCCTSVNHVICHGIPGNKILYEGDIINVDVTFIQDGWHGDSNKMYLVGRVSQKAEHLCHVTHQCLLKAISIVKDGIPLRKIGQVIQEYAEREGFSVVRDFCGHGIGRTFHGSPEVLHYGSYPHDDNDTILREGMFFTIEPMINIGKYDVKILNDGWTAVTKDKSLSAQYEHTIGVTKDGCIVFTQAETSPIK